MDVRYQMDVPIPVFDNIRIITFYQGVTCLASSVSATLSALFIGLSKGKMYGILWFFFLLKQFQANNLLFNSIYVVIILIIILNKGAKHL